MAEERKPIIFSVDDDVQVLKSLKRDLRNAYKKEYRIISTDSANEGLEALEELKAPIYDPDLLVEDKEFVLKKLKFSEEEFDELMKMPPIPHKAYGYTKSFFEQYPFLKFLKPLIKNIRRY